MLFPKDHPNTAILPRHLRRLWKIAHFGGDIPILLDSSSPSLQLSPGCSDPTGRDGRAKGSDPNETAQETHGPPEMCWLIDVDWLAFWLRTGFHFFTVQTAEVCAQNLSR